MNVHELDAKLAAAGIDGRTYHIAGVEPRGRLGEGSWILVPAENEGWAFRIWERGQEWPEDEFATEDEACRWIYNFVVNHKRGL